MAITSSAVKALQLYMERADQAGAPYKETIRAAITLTETQRQGIEGALQAFWGKKITCPTFLDIKPHHGYQSRVLKDGFPSSQYLEWLVIGCSDVAQVSTDHNGRPCLLVPYVDDGRKVIYDVLAPIRSTQEGAVYVDDVIPKGLPPRQ